MGSPWHDMGSYSVRTEPRAPGRFLDASWTSGRLWESFGRPWVSFGELPATPIYHKTPDQPHGGRYVREPLTPIS